jgi:ribosome-binding protein aMBF1 (putative translation factor)
VNAHARPVAAEREAQFEQQLARCADDVDERRDALEAARELRDRRIVEAIDEAGWSTKRVARAARVSQSRVMAILSDSRERD